MWGFLLLLLTNYELVYHASVYVKNVKEIT